MDTQASKKIQWFEQLFNSPTIGILIVDNERKNLAVNDRTCKLFGYKREELVGQSAAIFHVDIEHFKEFASKAFDLVMAGKPIEMDHKFRKKDGTLFWGHIAGDLVKDANEVLWTIIDISERVLLEEHVRAKKKQLTAINTLIHLGTWELDLKTKKATLSDEMYRLLGAPIGSEIYLDDYLNYLHPEDRPLITQSLERMLKGEETKGTYLRILRQKEGQEEIVYVFQKGILVYDENHQPKAAIGATLDISEQKRLEHSLEEQKRLYEYQAYHDALTGLPNRLLLMDRIDDKIKRARRRGNRVAILFIDLDNFKALNDSLGHEAGDYYLKELAKNMRKHIRESDTLARLGGDEFVIVLDDIEHVDAVTEIVVHGMEMIEEPIKVEDKVIFPRMSVGVALYPDNGSDATTLLKNADAAMYKAKRSGRHTYSFYSEEMTQEAFRRINFEQELKQAIEKDELEVFYQPQIDAVKNELIGMEALVRWNHPEKGLLLPHDFIPLAEESNLILNINRWVFDHAIAQHNIWHKEGKNPGVLALNLTNAQLSCDTCFKHLKALTKELEYRSEWLELEVTEGQLIKDPKQAVKMLNLFHEFGVKIAIDDFGTGYSSLAYLRDMPIQKLKIDKSFIDDLPENHDDANIVMTIIGLAHNLGLELLAEGVEQEKQLEFLKQKGCHLIQGYYFSKPLSASDMELYLDTF